EPMNTKDTANVKVAITEQSQMNGLDFANIIANTVSHEIAHTFSINEGYILTPRGTPIDQPPYDLMEGGSSSDAKDLGFGAYNVQLIQASMGIISNTDRPLTDALSFYEKYSNASHNPPGLHPEYIASPQPQLDVVAGGTDTIPGDQIALPSAVADGPAGAGTTMSFALLNVGTAPLTVSGVSLANGRTGFSLEGPNLAGTTLQPGESAPLTVRFAPSVSGPATDALVVASDATAAPTYQLNLRATGLPPAGAVMADVPNNNAGGAVVGAAPVTVSHFVHLSNQG